MVRAYSALPPPQKNNPAAKFTSQGDAHMRTNAQIKFLYYPLVLQHGSNKDWKTESQVNRAVCTAPV